MEDALQKLMKESGASKYAGIANAASKALGLLEAYERAPASDYRQNALDAVRHTLESGSAEAGAARPPRIVSAAVTVLQKLLRDDRFHSKEPEENEELWMSSQVLTAVRGTDGLAEEHKQEVLKVLLSLSCHGGWTLNGHLVIRLLTLCLSLYAGSGNNTKAAAQATASQNIVEYCKDLRKKKGDGDGGCEERYNDSIPVFQFVTSRLDDLIKLTESSAELPLLLLCLQTLVRHAPPDLVTRNRHFRRYASARLAPTAISLLELADARAGRSAFWQRRAETVLRLSDANVRSLAPACVELAPLLGPCAEMRPVLECVYHRMLSCSQPQTRAVALAELKEMLRDPEKVMLMAAYDNAVADADGEAEFDSMPLFKLIADSLEDCARMADQPKLVVLSTQCVAALMQSLERIAMGRGFDRETADAIMRMYPKLRDADYTGPNTYDGTARWPESCTEALAKRKKAKEDGVADGDSASSKSAEHDGSSGKEEVKDEAKAEEDEKEEGGGDEEAEAPTNKADDEARDEEEASERDKSRTSTSNYSDACSEATEGPEEGFDEDQAALKLDAYLNEAEEMERESAIFHNNRIPRSLVGKDDDSDDGEPGGGMEAEAERSNARQFVSRLREGLDSIVAARGSVEMDHRIQQFSSNFCHEFSTHSPGADSDADVVILNADGVYLTAYCALHLGLKLSMDGAYGEGEREDDEDGIPFHRSNVIERQHFVDSILSSGLLVYVSPVWLAEVYDVVTEFDALGLSLLSGRGRLAGLKSLLADLEGFGEAHRGAQVLGDFKRFRLDVARVTASCRDDDEAGDPVMVDAGRRICRHILTTCWSSFLSHLLACLGPYLAAGRAGGGTGGGGGGIVGGLFRRQRSAAENGAHRGGGGGGSGDERLSRGIECLQAAVMLCSELELHDRCGEMLEPLTFLICLDPLEGGKLASSRAGKRSSSSTLKSAKCSSLINLICVEDILVNGFELASQSQDCWKYVMRCVTHVLHMESERSSRNILAAKKGRKKKRDDGTANSSTSAVTKDRKESDDLDLCFDDIADSEEPISQSAFSLPPGFDVDAENKGLKEAFAHKLSGKGSPAASLTLSPDELNTANSILTACVERLFDDAATKLNLKSLMGFMTELSFCSHKQLLSTFPRKKKAAPVAKLGKQQAAASSSSEKCVATQEACSTLLFHRISEVMLKCVRSGRPLLHIVRAWAVVGPHLTEAACHKEDVIAKKSVEYVHDIITAFLQNTSELPYFHFNETLFKPFENLVCLELCDADIQDQIVACICEFVETSTGDIGSGWRSLFGTLKAVKFPPPALHHTDRKDEGREEGPAPEEVHWRAVIDVFEAFLATENPQVFANAALDFVSCLVHHVRGSDERQQMEELITLEEMDEMFEGSERRRRRRHHDTAITEAAVDMLQRCNAILAKMYRMTTCPIFQVAHRVRILPSLAVVDPVIPDLELRSFDVATDTLPDFPYSFKSLQTTDQKNSDRGFLEDDRARGLLRVWYLLFDGLTSAVTNCPREQQSNAVDALFAMLGSLQHQEDDAEDGDGGGGELLLFGLYCTNHLLLPMMQHWLRRSQRTFRGWTAAGPNFKHCTGKTTELVLGWVARASASSANKHPKTSSLSSGADLALKQTLLLLVECTTVPVESVARLGCSCLRHIIQTRGPSLSSRQWDLVCLSLCRAARLTLYPLHQLMSPFHRGSENFYGDVGDVKVAARRDSCKRETHRLTQLAHQVLLLDQQKPELPAFPDNPEVEERSFLFHLHPPTINGQQATTVDPQSSPDLLRVSVRSILTGITAHHILLQLLGSVLLQGTKNLVPSLANLLLHGSILPPLTPCVETAPRLPSPPALGGNNASSSLPGMLDSLSYDQVHMLLSSLKASYHVGLEFDSRPGLKFLVQKVTQLANAANLYKQAGAAWSLTAMTLFDLCLARLDTGKVGAEDIKKALEARQRNRNTINNDSHKADEEETVEADGGEEKTSSLLDTDAFFLDLHDLFLEVCELYVDVVVDKDGRHARADKICGQQLYFLTVEPDDFHQFVARKDRTKEDGDDDLESVRTRGISEVNEEEEKDEEETKKTEEEDSTTVDAPSKPFQFSDFASQPVRPESPNVSEDSDFRAKRETEDEEGDVGSQEDEGRRREGSVLAERRLESLTSDGGGGTGATATVGSAPEGDEEVFRVATQGEMDCMMSEYRSKKSTRTMPSASSVSSVKDAAAGSSSATPPTSADARRRRNPFAASSAPSSSPAVTNPNAVPADPEIASQRTASLLADSEARSAVWTELAQVVFRLAEGAPDERFRQLLPLLFPGVRALTAHAADEGLKASLADFFQRVAAIYGFDPESP